MKDFIRNTWKHRAHVVLALPAFLILFFIMYVPMTGLVVAFKDFKPAEGIWGSAWNGIENFKFIVQNKAAFITMTRNTILYYIIFTAIGTSLNVILAIAIDQFCIKKMGKTMQTLMIIPVFISYAAVQFIVAAFIGSNGIIISVAKDLFDAFSRLYETASANGWALIPAIADFLADKIKPWTNMAFYAKTSANKWPWILTIVKTWKDTGYGSVLYMSVLAGIDTELYEAAEIDGAGKWKQILHITLPSLIPMITVMLLLSVGNVMRSDTGLFYQVTRNIGQLYSTTQVIDSYVLDAIKSSGKFGYTMAASLFQSVVGLLMMLFANWMVKKIEPENALF